MSVYEDIFKTHGLSESQKKIIELVGNNKKVLEIGSSSGYMTKFFVNNGCRVDVVEIDKEAAKKITDARKVINSSIEDASVIKLVGNDYNFIVLADVLEHLVFPEKALEILRQIATNDTKLIISMPNIASWPMRKQLFFKGDFQYQKSGPLDKTHLHFYTVNSLPKFLVQNDWKVSEIIGSITRVPFEGFINKLPLVNLLFKYAVKKRIIEAFRNLTYYHFIVVATK